MARLADRFQIEVPLQELFEVADFADLADRITARELEAAGSEELQEMLAELGLSEGGSR